MSERRFEDRVAVITGAAGGIGRAAAGRFAREGAHIVAVDLAGTPLDDTVKEVEAAGGKALAVTADVGSEGDVAAVMSTAVEAFGGIDVLFNNAGVEGGVTPMDEYSVDLWDQVFAVNVRGVFLGIKHAVPALRARGGGVIVNTSSVAGLVGNPMIPAYVAAKHAVLGLTKSAALTYAAENIRVNAVCPAPIETRMMRALEAGLVPDDVASAKEMMKASIPQGRYGTPDEVAALVAFLCCDEAGFITGASYAIDGGMSVA